MYVYDHHDHVTIDHNHHDNHDDQASPEQQHWTALHYATMIGNYDVVRLLNDDMII